MLIHFLSTDAPLLGIFYINGVMWYTGFHDWLCSLSIIFSKFILMYQWSTAFSWANYVPLNNIYMYIYLKVHILKKTLTILFSYLFLAVLGLYCSMEFSLVATSWGYSSLQCTVFPFWWLLLLWTMDFRESALAVAAQGLSSCNSWTPEHRLSSCGIWA